MSIRFKAGTANGEVRLMLPEGRQLGRDGWYATANITTGTPRLLALRVWTPAAAGYRVITIDRDGTEYDSLRVSRYDDARTVMEGLSGSVTYPHVEGRRLVSGGDELWEIAAELKD